MKTLYKKPVTKRIACERCGSYHGVYMIVKLVKNHKNTGFNKEFSFNCKDCVYGESK